MFIHFYTHDISIFFSKLRYKLIKHKCALCHWPKFECIQLNFPSKPFFAICLNFQQQYPPKIK
jgi:hypothetical protein